MLHRGRVRESLPGSGHRPTPAPCLLAANQRQQRALEGLSPTAKVAERLRKIPRLRNRCSKTTSDASIMNNVDRIMTYANDLTQPDS